jgi:hypothetical protein
MLKHTLAVINVVTRASLTSDDEGRTFFEILGSFPTLVPEKVGNYEPIRTTFNPADLETSISVWRDWPFLWKRKMPSSQGCVYKKGGPTETHGWINLGVRLNSSACPGDFSRAAVALALAFDADFAFAHCLRRGEREDRRQLDTGLGKQSLSVPPIELEKCIPDLFTLTIFGPSYIDLFGREKLLSAPCHQIERISPTLIGLWLAESLLSERDSVYEETNRKTKEHLGLEYFAECKSQLAGRCVAPDFAELRIPGPGAI